MKKVVILFLLVSLLFGCAPKKEVTNKNGSVYYEIFVASFHDSDGDGVGDLNGIIEKLDYLQDLGVSGIWLMPIHPSNTYHKYDVLDYMAIDESYGTIEDFKALVQEAKKHNIDIIIDLVLNHTSSKHPWFKEAKDAVMNDACDTTNKCEYYHFSKSIKKGYTRIHDQLFYEAVFWSEMPDLNLANQDVRKEIEGIVDFWLDLGVKGFRLDAPYHYFDHNTGLNNEFLAWLTTYVKSKREDAFMVGEVWADQQTVLNHFESGLDSFFDFASSNTDGRIVSALRSKNGHVLSQYLADYYNAIKNINAEAISSIFLSNHDQGRSAAFFLDEQQRKLAASIYLLAPAIPFVYYGEEIGMLGSGRDENKRLAMVWGEGKDTKSPKDADYAGEFNSSVKEQLKDKNSLLNHYKKVIQLRNQYLDIQNVKIQAYLFKNKHLCAIEYIQGDKTVMVVHNLSGETIVDELTGYRIVDQVVLSKKATIQQDQLTIAPYSTVILNK